MNFWSKCSACPEEMGIEKVSSSPHYMGSSVPQPSLIGQRGGHLPEHVDPPVLTVLHPGMW